MKFDSFCTIDIILFVVFILAGISGARKGLLEEVSQKFGFVFGFLIAIIFTKVFSGTISERFSLSPWLSCAVSYVVLFLAGYLIVKFLGKILKDAFESNITVFLNGFLGFFIKIIEVIIVCGAVIHVLENQTLINMSDLFEKSIINEKLLSPVIEFCISLFDGAK